MILKAEALVLRRIDYSNTSQIITFFSRSYGKIEVIAKGIKKAGPRFQGALDLLSQARIVFYQKRAPALSILAECELCNTFLPLRQELSRLFTALYLIEFTKELTQQDQPQPLLYDLLVNMLHLLAQGGQGVNVLFHFQTNALEHLGLMPVLGFCLDCHQPLMTLQGQRVFFVPAAGGILCRACAHKRHCSCSVVSKGALTILQQLKQAAWGSLDRIRPTHLQVREISQLLGGFITYVAEKKLKMERYLRESILR